MNIDIITFMEHKTYRIFRLLIVGIFICFLSNNIIAQENDSIFRNINLGESSAKIISIEGLPDLIYSNEYQDGSVFSSLIWVNPLIDNNELLQLENNNIQIGGDINNILDNYNAISFHYNDIPFLDFNSKMVMEFRNNILIFNDFIIVMETREIGSSILNHYGKLYGEPKRIERFTLLWELETIKIIFQLRPILNNGNRTDVITISYSNKDDSE